MSQRQDINPNQTMGPPRRVPMLHISPPKTDSITEVEAASVSPTQCPVYNLLETQETNTFTLDLVVSQKSKSDENIPFCSICFHNENSQGRQQSSMQDEIASGSTSQHPTSDVAHS